MYRDASWPTLIWRCLRRGVETLGDAQACFEVAIGVPDVDTNVATALAWKYWSTSGSEENSSSMAPCAAVIVA